MQTALKALVLGFVPLLALVGCPSDGPTQPASKAEVAKSSKPDSGKTTATSDTRKATFVVSGMS